MTPGRITLLFITIFFLPMCALADGVTEKDFEAHTAEQFVRLCSVSPEDPMYHQAINFCHGYFEGAYQYYEAMTSGPKGIKFVCVPDPLPSRNDAISWFVDWVKANPQHMDEQPVEAQFRFLMERFPCK